MKGGRKQRKGKYSIQPAYPMYCIALVKRGNHAGSEKVRSSSLSPQSSVLLAFHVFFLPNSVAALSSVNGVVHFSPGCWHWKPVSCHM